MVARIRRSPCSSAPRSLAHVPTFSSSKTTGATAARSRRSSPPSAGSTNSSNAAPSTDSSGPAHASPINSSFSPLISRATSLRCAPSAWAPCSSSNASGSRPAVPRCSNNSWPHATSRSPLNARSSSRCCTACSNQAVTAPPTSGNTTICWTAPPTSTYFEGEGGEELGQYGHSKDHRPDLYQMIVGAVLDGDGRPICCAMWPGNTTDVKTLIPIVDDLYRRFGIVKVCIVADRGMISQETIDDLDQQGWPYILGARMRRCKEVREQVLNDRGRFRVVHPKSRDPKDPSPLKVKDVRIEDRRYVVCVNEDEVKKDRADREAILAGLREQLQQGDKSLVGNKGYRRYLKVEGPGHFAIDEAKIAEEARYDGTWVLRTSTALPTAEVALQFKRLWQVEQWFRSCKSLLETRPIYHQRDETIRGHVFCSLLALLLRYELQTRLAAHGKVLEWADVVDDLERLQYVEVEQDGKRFRLRTELQGSCGQVFRAVGVAIPPTVQQLP